MQQDDFYNILTDDLPKSVNVNGVNYPVRTNFKDWILFFFLHEDVDLTDIEKIMLSMDWYLDAVPTQKVAAYQALQKFAACDRMPKSKRKAAGVRRAPAFSYLHDSTYLFADFLRFYQINLQTTQLHWFAFNALFEGLPDESCTKQRIAYRCLNIGKIKDKEERKRILQIKNAIAIPQKPMTAGEVGNLFG